MMSKSTRPLRAASEVLKFTLECLYVLLLFASLVIGLAALHVLLN